MVGVGCHSEVTSSSLLITLLCAVSHFDATAHALRLVIISYSSEHFTGCAKGRLWSTAQTIAVEKGSPRVTLYGPSVRREGIEELVAALAVAKSETYGLGWS